MQGGGILNFTAMVICGNGDGVAGFGKGKSAEISSAVDKVYISECLCNIIRLFLHWILMSVALFFLNWESILHCLVRLMQGLCAISITLKDLKAILSFMRKPLSMARPRYTLTLWGHYCDIMCCSECCAHFCLWLSVRYSEGMSGWPLDVYEAIVCPSRPLLTWGRHFFLSWFSVVGFIDLFVASSVRDGNEG